MLIGSVSPQRTSERFRTKTTMDTAYHWIRSSKTVLVILIVIVHAVSWLPRYLLWEPLANWRMQGHKTWDQSEAQKFSQTATSLLFFCSSSFFVWRLLSPRDWLYSRAGWKMMGPLTDADFRFYYLLYSARFLSDLISIFFEDRKKVRPFSGKSTNTI